MALSSNDKWPPVHPGEILLREFLEPLGMNCSELAEKINVPARRLRELVQGKRDMTGDAALRLSRYFGNSPEFWINLQGHYELQVAQDALEDRLEKEVAVRAA